MGGLANSRGADAISWIEKFCVYPDGPTKGRPVCLSPEQRQQIRTIYDGPDGPQDIPVSDSSLAAYLALMHICGREALQRDFCPHVEVDTWTVWRATSERLQRFLKRDGAAVVCPYLGTRYPAAA
jgi:hypothetical protein